MSSTSSARKKNMGNSSSQTQAKKKTSTLTNSKLTDTYQNTAPSPSPSAPAKSFSSTPGSVATTPGTVLNGFLSGRGRGLTRTSNIERDLVVFPNDLKRDDNLKFYRNEIKSKPFPGTKFKDMMRWKGDYHKLEYEHQYIQWLFPLPEGKGLNYSAQPLQEHEAIAIQSDSQIRLNVLRAYTMMLDFYGMELVSSDTGEVKRSKNYIERFEHLNRSMHNYRRITRIIKSLGCLGFGHLQAPWVRFIIKEALVEKTLPRLNGRSMYHWIDAIADTKEREDTLNYFLKLSEGSDVDFIDNDIDENMDFDVGSGHVAGNGSSADRVHGVDSGRQNYSVQAGDYERSVNGRGVDNEHGKVRNDNSGHSSERGHFEGTSDTANNLARNLAAASSVGTSDNIDKSDPTCKVEWDT